MTDKFGNVFRVVLDEFGKCRRKNRLGNSFARSGFERFAGKRKEVEKTKRYLRQLYLSSLPPSSVGDYLSLVLKQQTGFYAEARVAVLSQKVLKDRKISCNRST